MMLVDKEGDDLKGKIYVMGLYCDDRFEEGQFFGIDIPSPENLDRDRFSLGKEYYNIVVSILAKAFISTDQPEFKKKLIEEVLNQLLSPEEEKRRYISNIAYDTSTFQKDASNVLVDAFKVKFPKCTLVLPWDFALEENSVDQFIDPGYIKKVPRLLYKLVTKFGHFPPFESFQKKSIANTQKYPQTVLEKLLKPELAEEIYRILENHFSTTKEDLEFHNTENDGEVVSCIYDTESQKYILSSSRAIIKQDAVPNIIFLFTRAFRYKQNRSPFKEAQQQSKIPRVPQTTKQSAINEEAYQTTTDSCESTPVLNTPTNFVEHTKNSSLEGLKQEIPHGKYECNMQPPTNLMDVNGLSILCQDNYKALLEEQASQNNRFSQQVQYMKGLCDQLLRTIECNVPYHIYHGSSELLGFAYNGNVYINVSPVCFSTNENHDLDAYVTMVLFHEVAHCYLPNSANHPPEHGDLTEQIRMKSDLLGLRTSL